MASTKTNSASTTKENSSSNSQSAQAGARRPVSVDYSSPETKPAYAAAVSTHVWGSCRRILVRVEMFPLDQVTLEQFMLI